MKKLLLTAFVLVLVMASNLWSQDFFADWDANKDGRITINEFPGGESNRDYFNQIDTNRDNIVSKKEFCAFMGIPYKEPEKPKKPKKPYGHHKKNRVKILKEKIRKLEAQLQNVEKMADKLRKENSTLKKDKYTLVKQVKQLKFEKMKLLKDIQTYKHAGSNNQDKRTIKNLQNQIAQLKFEQMKLLKDIQNYKHAGNNNQNKYTIKNLQNQIAQLNTEKSKLIKQLNFYKRLAESKKKVDIPVTPVKPTIPVKKKVYIKRPEVRKPTKAQSLLMAEEAAKNDAYRKLAENIRGSWIAACSQNVDGKNKLLIIGQLDPTKLVGVDVEIAKYDFANGKVTVPVKISRAYIIESIKRTNKGLTQEEYMDLRYMFPKELRIEGYGAWRESAQKQLLALYGAQLDARRRLVERLRGFLIKSSARMENFVVQKHEVVVSIENTLLVGIKVIDEKIIQNSIAQSTIQISRTMFIYSMRRGLEAHGLELNPDEYQNLRNMLSNKEYNFTGKAAIK